MLSQCEEENHIQAAKLWAAQDDVGVVRIAWLSVTRVEVVKGAVQNSH